MDANRLAEIAAALGVEARANVGCALMSGTAHTATELGHDLLTMMLRDGWLRRHPQRHRELLLTACGRRELAARLDLEVT